MADNDYGKQGRDTELVLDPGVFAYVRDNTKGNINTYCGPYKSSLSNTDQLVTYNSDTMKFVPSRDQQTAIQTNILVPKGSYVVLENPSLNGKQPEPGKTETMTVGSLMYGQIQNLSGPQSFALWPGQVATVIKGHDLRSNQYLLVRVNDSEAAKSNWDKSVVQGVSGDPTEATVNVLGIDKNALVTGQTLVIKGTSVAFYIPPTGVDVLTDEFGKYVRDAVTLERLEYSILLGENGNKQYIKGPDVVFPTPTQQFYIKDGARKFRAQELQPTSGMHIKVIADYTENGIAYTAGQELHITGADQPIYYPREEHSVIMYGIHEKSFAVAIPAGEGRYVLDRETGVISTIVGPDMFLPDPRKQVIIRRALTDSECQLYYPGNEDVRLINAKLRGEEITSDDAQMGGGYRGVQISALESTRMTTRSGFIPESYADATPREAVGRGVAGDQLNRGTKYTPQRTIVLNTKCDGAVRISPWSGFAVQVVDSKGNRNTVIGPQTVLLNYDETLERLSLSKGKPKNSDTRMNTAYLRYISNPVSDIISLKTQDMVPVDVQIKYLVRFEEADKDRWFSIDNYVQYLVDHLRSLIGNTVRNIGVQEFYSNAAEVLRDTVLGTKGDDNRPGATPGVRPLKHFSENGMTVYDLELISITVKDSNIAELLSKARQDTLTDAIELERMSARLSLVKGREDIQRQIDAEKAATIELQDRLAAEKTAREIQAHLVAIESENKMAIDRTKGALDAAAIAAQTKALYLETKKAETAFDQIVAEQEADRTIKLLIEEAAASKTRMESVQPALVESLVALAQAGQFEKIAQHLAPLSIVQGQSLSGTLQTMFAGTPLEGMVENISNLSRVKATAK